MALASGVKLGPYEILSPAGSGGMGEVYRARDTRLDRTVAIKVLPSHLSSSAELKQRFEREAKAISSLQHPNICTLHDIGSQDGIHFLVMEYLEGQTLADRLARGALPLDQVLRIGIEIAEALAKAHRQGIVHRDLKPGNIMLTKAGAKLMDFGLAKPSNATFAAVASPLIHSTPTMSVTNLAAPAAPLTQVGAVMGTYQYMAPEVLQGQEADARSDVFALGVVLYEMATGQHAFEGKTTASVIAAILEKDPPPISQTQSVAPPVLDFCVRTCLAKNPDDRYQTAHDVKLQLEWVQQQQKEGSAKASIGQRWSPRGLALAVALLLGLITMGAFVLWSQWPTMPVLRTAILPPADTEFSFSGDFSAPPALSPDGKFVVFGARTKQGKKQLWLRPLNRETATVLEGAEGALFPFWSPDSRWIAFFADGKLKKLAVSGGSPITIADAVNGRGGAWSNKGIIIFAPDFRGPLFQVSEKGGAVSPVTKVDLAYHTTHRWPVFLPDQKHFLFLANNHTGGNPGRNGIYIAALGSQDAREVVATDAAPMYSDGYLLFHSGASLMAQSLDGNGNLSGQPIQVVDEIGNDVSVWRMAATVSDTGLMAFRSGGSSDTGLELVWYDRSGKQLGKVGDRAVYRDPRLSPDGKQLAVVESANGSGPTLFVIDLNRKIQSRFTFDAASHVSPSWSPDGRKIAYSAVQGNGNAGWSIYVKDVASGGGPVEVVPSVGQDSKNAPQWSPDGKYLLYQEQDGPRGGRIAAKPLLGQGQGKPFVVAAPQSSDGNIYPGFEISPDGHWVVYQCDDSGIQQIYIAPFPGPGGRIQVTNMGGAFPKWGAGGKELFYLGINTGYLTAVSVSAKGTDVQFGQPQGLFQYPFAAVGNFVYDVSADGRKFLLNTAVENEKVPFSLVTNWTSELKKK